MKTKQKNLKKTFKAIMLFFIIVPMLLVSVVGLVSVSSFSAGLTADSAAALAYSQTTGISALVGEYIAFLDTASELEVIRLAASTRKADEQAAALMSAYVENTFGVYDMLLTDSRGFIFASHSGNYGDGESFRDTAELERIIATPTPVSGFFDNNSRFYCVSQIGQDEKYGYIILIADAGVISDFMLQSSLQDNRGVFAIFDENDNIISSGGETSGLLRDSVAIHSHATGLLEHDRFERGGHFGSVGTISGTRWRWIALYPTSTAAASTFWVFLIAFAVSAVICTINIIIRFKSAKGLFNPLKSMISRMKKRERLSVPENKEYAQLAECFNALLNENLSAQTQNQPSP